MANIVGVKEAKEISLTPEGANQHSHVLMRKSLAPPPSNPASAAGGSVENDMADLAMMKAVLAMNEVTKAYFLGLEDEAATAFLKKSAEERDAEAKTAHDAAEKAKADAAAAEAAKTAKDASVEERLKAAEARSAELQKRLDEQNQERDLEKAAAAPEFDGYPGGQAAVVAKLKTLSQLSETDRKPFIDEMKSMAAMSKRIGGGLEFGGRTEEELEKSAPNTAKFEKKVREVMEEKGISKSAATAQVAAMPAFKSVYEGALRESGAL